MLEASQSFTVRRHPATRHNLGGSQLQHESINEALQACIDACGGTRAVGAALWPEKTPDAARRLLSDCLSDSRAEKLSPEQLIFILRLAAGRGCHAGMEYLAGVLGYAPPVPVARGDVKAELQRRFIESTQELAKLAESIRAMDEPPAMRVVS